MTSLQWVGYNHFPHCRAWVDKHFDGYCVLNYAHRGRIRLQVGDTAETTLRGPVAWWTFPGPRFRFGCRDLPPWEHRFASFKGPDALSLLKKGLYVPGQRAPYCIITSPDRFRIAFDELLAYLAAPVYGMQRSIHMMQGLLLQLHEQPPEIRPDVHHTSAFESLLRRIGEDLRHLWNFEAEAEAMSLSYPHFRRLFKLAAGQSPARYLTIQRMRHAGSLLRAGQLPIKDIAMQVGYEDIYHFTKRFSAFFGMPPGRYRKEALMG